MKQNISFPLLATVPMLLLLLACEQPLGDSSSDSFLDEYESKEVDEYYQKCYDAYKSEPLSAVEVAEYCNPFFEVNEIEDYTPYIDSIMFTPYQDSFFNACYRRHEDFVITNFGKISMMDVYKQERHGDTVALLYMDRDFGNDGWSIGLSFDNENTWHYYYIGLNQAKPMFLKWYSNLPLIDKDGNLQIEACLLRRYDERRNDCLIEKYQLVKDGLLITINQETLRKDSDGDGLTDIVEYKWHTNPNNSDTDNDGVTDNLDLNPRFSSHRTEQTPLFEMAINRDYNRPFLNSPEGKVIPFSAQEEIHYATDSTETVMVMTDDPNLIGIQSKLKRIVFITSEEYKKFFGRFDDGLQRYYVTPLFKIDSGTNAYFFSIGGSEWNCTYYVTKERQGWKIDNMSVIIE